MIIAFSFQLWKVKELLTLMPNNQQLISAITASVNGGVQITNRPSTLRYLRRNRWVWDGWDLRDSPLHPFLLEERNWGTEVTWDCPQSHHGRVELAICVTCQGVLQILQAAPPWPSSAQTSFLLKSWVAKQELGPSLEVVIKSKLEPWGGSSKSCCSAEETQAWGQYQRPSAPDSRYRWWMGSLTWWSKLIIASPTTTYSFLQRGQFIIQHVTLPMSSPEIKARGLRACASHHITPLLNGQARMLRQSAGCFRLLRCLSQLVQHWGLFLLLREVNRSKTQGLFS